jgi:hypothetical protein
VILPPLVFPALVNILGKLANSAIELKTRPRFRRANIVHAVAFVLGARRPRSVALCPGAATTSSRSGVTMRPNIDGSRYNSSLETVDSPPPLNKY